MYGYPIYKSRIASSVRQGVFPTIPLGYVKVQFRVLSPTLSRSISERLKNKINVGVPLRHAR